MKRIERNIKTNYIYQCLRYLDMSTAIWVLYLGAKGMSLVEIGLLESIYHITSLIFEVPSGAVADLLGRKKTITVGRLCAIISSLIMVMSNHFLGFGVGFIFCALGNNLGSGTEEALVYDSLKQAGNEEAYIKINGRSNSIIAGVQGIGAFLGVIISKISFQVSYLVGMAASSMALVTSLFFIEPENQNIQQNVSMKAHFKKSFECIKANKKIIFLLIFYPMISMFAAIIYFYGQRYFSDLKFGKIEMGIIFLIDSIFASSGEILSSKVKEKLKGKAGFVMGLIMSGAILGLAVCGKWMSLPLFWLITLSSSTLDPISSEALNELIEVEQRATIISVNSMAFSVMMILVFPIAGFVAEHTSMKVTFIGISLIMLVGLELCNRLSKRLMTSKEYIEEKIIEEL